MEIRTVDVRGVQGIYAAGDAIDFPVKHGGVGSQQADVAAQSIAALAGASVTPEPFNPSSTACCSPMTRPCTDREDHRRPRVQLGNHRHTHVVAAEQDRREVPRAVSRRAGPREHLHVR